MNLDGNVILETPGANRNQSYRDQTFNMAIQFLNKPREMSLRGNDLMSSVAPFADSRFKDHGILNAVPVGVVCSIRVVALFLPANTGVPDSAQRSPGPPLAGSDGVAM